jgi:hypothetical protein
MSRTAARARNGALVGGRDAQAQQLGQNCCPELVHFRAHQHLDGFQVQVLGLAPAGEEHAQQSVHFARDFPLDGFDRFFSSGERVSATGRARQIFSLISSNS